MKFQSGIHIKLGIIATLIACAVIVSSSTFSVAVTGETPVSTNSTPAETLEGCLKCHDKIEPMHRFGPTATLDNLDHEVWQNYLDNECSSWCRRASSPEPMKQ